jgi:hypothetical protein
MTSELKVMSESGAVTVDYLALLGLGRDIANIVCEWGVVSLKRFVAVSPNAGINISSQSSPIYATLLVCFLFVCLFVVRVILASFLSMLLKAIHLLKKLLNNMGFCFVTDGQYLGRYFSASFSERNN